jgi:hypothetical protein
MNDPISLSVKQQINKTIIEQTSQRNHGFALFNSKPCSLFLCAHSTVIIIMIKTDFGQMSGWTKKR